MIKTFADEITEDIFHGIHSHAVHKNFNAHLLKATERKLDLLNCIETLDSLKMIPSHRSDGLARDAHDKYSIPIEGKFRLAFRWNNGDVTDVELKTSIT